MKRKGVLYLEIAQTIKHDIQNNVYLVGELLPTENELEEKFNVSKITIRKAMEVLALQGYVEKKSGKGTTVISNRLFNNLSKGDSFSSVLEKRGIEVSKEIVAIEQVQLNSNDFLYPYFGDEATKVTRMYVTDNEPYILFNHYLPEDTLIPVRDELEKKSLYSILAEQNYLVDRFEDQFSITALGDEEQSLLKTEESHGMKRVRRSYDGANKVIEVAVSIYNTTIQPYEIHFEI